MWIAQITPKMISRKMMWRPGIVKSGEEAAQEVARNIRGLDLVREDDNARGRVRGIEIIGVEADRFRTEGAKGLIRRVVWKNRRKKAVEGTIRGAVRRSIGADRAPDAAQGPPIVTITRGNEAEVIDVVRRIEKVRVIKDRDRGARLAWARWSRVNLWGKWLKLRKLSLLRVKCALVKAILRVPVRARAQIRARSLSSVSACQNINSIKWDHADRE